MAAEKVLLADLADEIGVRVEKIRYWIRVGRLPAAEMYCGRLAWTESQADKAREFFANRLPYQRG